MRGVDRVVALALGLGGAGIAALALLAAPLGVPPGRAQLMEEEGVYRTRLPNGITVVTRERPGSEVAALAIYVRGGSRDEDPTTVGAAHFMEHMFFQGTPRRPSSAAIDAPITERGGWLNATTSWEGIDFFATLPNADFPVAVDVLSDILINSLFEPAALEKERRVVIEELNRILNDPLAFAIETFAKTVFADHPARQLPAGDRTTVRSVSRDVLLSFRDRYFRAANLVIAAVGDLRHDDVVAQIATAFAAMPDGAAPTFQRAAPPPPVRREQRLSMGARQAQIVLGWPTAGLDSPDRYALTVLNAALGAGGQRLAAELRDRLGLVSRIDTGYWELTDVGTWLIAAASEPARADEAVTAMLAEARRLHAEPLSAEEVAEAKAYVRGSTRRGLERAVDQARDLAAGVALGYYQPLAQYLARIDAVTPEDIQRVARAYLDPDNYTLVIVGP